MLAGNQELINYVGAESSISCLDMLKLSDHVARVHCPSIQLVSFSVLYGDWRLRYKRFCWCTPSFFIDFSLIHKEPINMHTTKIADYLFIRLHGYGTMY